MAANRTTARWGKETQKKGISREGYLGAGAERNEKEIKESMERNKRVYNNVNIELDNRNDSTSTYAITICTLYTYIHIQYKHLM